MNTIKKNLICPLTGLLFYDPVLADDGFIYEYMAIRKWLSEESISPSTGKSMSTTLLKVNCIKNIVGEYMLLNPSEINNQFINRKPYYLFKSEFYDFIKNKNFDCLKQYVSFELNNIIGRETLIEFICKNCPPDIIKHVIDNSIDFDAYDHKNMKPIHTVCRLSSEDIIKFLIDKGIDLDSKDVVGNSPLIYLIIFHSKKYDLIKYLLKNNVNVNNENNINHKPIHYILTHGDIELFKLLIEYKINLISTSKSGLNTLQYAFTYGRDVDIIKYLIDNEVNLGIDVNPDVMCEQLLYNNENFNKLEKQSLVLYYLTKVMNRTEIVNDYL